MSQLSVLLKNIVGMLALNEGDKQRLHAEIDTAVPAALGVAAGVLSGKEAVNAVVVPLLQDVLNLSEQRLMNYVERRLAGASVHASIPPPLVVPAGVDPSLISAAPPETTDPETVGAIIVGNEDAVSIPDASAPHVPDTAPAVVEEPAPNVVYDSPHPATEPQLTEIDTTAEAQPAPVVEAPAVVVVEEPAPVVEAAPAVVEVAPDTAPPSLGDQHNGGDAESFEPAPSSLDVQDDDPKWRAMGYAFDPMTGEPL